MGQHSLGDFEVGDDAVFERTDGHNIARRAAEHALGLVADGKDLVRAGLHGDHGWLAQDNALIADVDQGVGRPEIDSDVTREEAEKLSEHDEWTQPGPRLVIPDPFLKKRNKPAWPPGARKLQPQPPAAASGRGGGRGRSFRQVPDGPGEVRRQPEDLFRAGDPRRASLPVGCAEFDPGHGVAPG